MPQGRGPPTGAARPSALGLDAGDNPARPGNKAVKLGRARVTPALPCAARLAPAPATAGAPPDGTCAPAHLDAPVPTKRKGNTRLRHRLFGMTLRDRLFMFAFVISRRNGARRYALAWRGGVREEEGEETCKHESQFFSISRQRSQGLPAIVLTRKSPYFSSSSSSLFGLEKILSAFISDKRWRRDEARLAQRHPPRLVSQKTLTPHLTPASSAARQTTEQPRDT